MLSAPTELDAASLHESAGYTVRISPMTAAKCGEGYDYTGYRCNTLPSCGHPLILGGHSADRVSEVTRKHEIRATTRTYRVLDGCAGWGSSLGTLEEMHKVSTSYLDAQ